MRLIMSEEHIAALVGLATLIISTFCGTWLKLTKTQTHAEQANQAVNQNDPDQPRLYEQVMKNRDSCAKLEQRLDTFIDQNTKVNSQLDQKLDTIGKKLDGYFKSK